MTLCCGAAIAVCGAMGGFSGLMITMFRVPPFITTLAVMQVVRGLALMITRSQSITGLPRSFDWLGLDADLWSIPNAVVLMALIYAAAQFVMARTRLGRHIYAVGGNREAARLSGIRINRVLMIVYVVCGAMAGLGGVIEASQFTSGDPKSGMMYELDVIAAVVVGGTSLAGGEGKIFGTLIGALIIAVIQNGMNLTEVEIYTQRVVLGLVILGAVLLDMLKRRGAKSDKG
jgi:ribose transport system permease protein